MTAGQHTVAQDLRHVLWIAGSPCSGKSTVSHLITRIYVFVDYHVDAWASAHFARRSARGDANARAFLQKSDDVRWLTPSLDEIIQTTQTSWMREFSLVIEDLLALPTENLIVAEGNFFPESVAPYLTHPHQALWMTPTPEFCDRARRAKQAALDVRRRRHGIVDESSDPERRLAALIARDVQLATEVKRQATNTGMSLMEVDGARTVEETLETVERHFDPYLLSYFAQQRQQGPTK